VHHRHFYGSLSISLGFQFLHGHKTPSLGVIKLKQINDNNNNKVCSLHHEAEGTISAKSNVTEVEEVDNTCKVD